MAIVASACPGGRPMGRPAMMAVRPAPCRAPWRRRRAFRERRGLPCPPDAPAPVRISADRFVAQSIAFALQSLDLARNRYLEILWIRRQRTVRWFLGALADASVMIKFVDQSTRDKSRHR